MTANDKDGVALFNGSHPRSYNPFTWLYCKFFAPKLDDLATEEMEIEIRDRPYTEILKESWGDQGERIVANILNEGIKDGDG